MEKVRLGIIGLGNMGSGHATNILAGKIKGLELTAIADAEPASGRQVAAQKRMGRSWRKQAVGNAPYNCRRPARFERFSLPATRSGCRPFDGDAGFIPSRNLRAAPEAR